MATALLLAPAAASAAEPLRHFEIEGVGVTPLVDYTQQSSSEPIALSGHELSLGLDLGFYCDNIPTLPNGQSYTLISTTGGLTGEFENAPDGTALKPRREGHDCGAGVGPGPKLVIHYQESGAVQTVTATVIEGSPKPVSSLALIAAPTPAEVNEPIGLTGVVQTSPREPLSEGFVGSISFAGEATLPGCGAVEVTQPETVLTGTCTASFPAGRVQINAEFTATEAAIAPSSQSTQLVIEKGTTTLGLTAGQDGAALELGAAIEPRFTGPVVPTGSVAFFLDGAPLAACAEQPLLRDEGAAKAGCDVAEPAPGLHQLEARYAGDANFEAVVGTATATIPPPAGGGARPGGSPPAETPPAPVSPARGAARATGALRLLATRIRVRRGLAAIPLACASSAACRGTITLRLARTATDTPLAVRSFEISAGRRMTLHLPVRKRALRRSHGRGVLTIAPSGGLATGAEVRLLEVR